MKIEKIQKLKNNKYKIVLENKEIITTYDDVILNNNLLFNKEISFEMINEINKQSLYYDCYNKVLKYIEKKIRSEREIKEYIDKINPEYTEEIIQKLKKINLINDENFVKAYVSDKIFLTTDGPNKIKGDLLKYNINESIIEKYINNIEENVVYEKCEKIINKKIKNNTKYSSYILNQKIISELLNKGYDLCMIKQILDKQTINNNSIIEKEYNKLYSKLSKKYEDSELQYMIKNKLYQKGFSSYDINEYIKTVE